MIWLNQTGAFITILLGLLGLFFPAKAAGFVSLSPDGPVGRSELRATYGGFFLLLGLGCLFLHTPPVFLLVGLAWIGAAFGRLFSILVDRAASAKNFGGVVFEAGIGLLLIC
jgi:hypothetical protein